MANIAFGLGIATFLLIHAAVACLALFAPQRVLAFVARRQSERPAGLPGLMSFVAAVLPYSWLLQGDRPDDFFRSAAVDPDRYPRMVNTLRIIGLIGFVAGILVATAGFFAISG